MQHAPFALSSCSRVVGVGLTWLAFTAPALAQSGESVPTPSQPTVVFAQASSSSEAFSRGLAAQQAGNHREAAAAFQLAYENDGDTSALLQWVSELTGLSRPDSAAVALNTYLAQADATRDASGIAAARSELESIRANSGRVHVNMLPENARLTVDGESVQLTADEVWVTPGKRQFTATAPGYLTFDQNMDVPAGQFAFEIKLQPEPPKVAPAIAAASVASEPSRSRELQEPTDEPEASKGGGCVMKELCIGPVVALLGPPNLIGGGVHLRFGRYLGAGVDYQMLPTLNFNPVQVGASLVSANARVYPFGGAFFLGGGFGYQSVRGQVHDGDILVAAKAGIPAAMASIGFMGHDGFILGADLGLMFPLGSDHVTVQNMSARFAQNSGVNQDDIDSAMNKAQSQVNKVVNALPVLLQVNLLRVGYLF
jgi:hypothetical protein